jgi:4-hydroxy-3-methylbut-2-enyl diphosphate reductase IspH
VQSASDLDPAWFKEFASVGLTAGTSTLSETIDEVHRALVWIGAFYDESRKSAAGGASGGKEPRASQATSLAEF